MATPAEIQAAMDSAATGRVANIQCMQNAEGTTVDDFYVVGVIAPYAGRSRWCRTTAADSAATQAASILAQLVA